MRQSFNTIHTPSPHPLTFPMLLGFLSPGTEPTELLEMEDFDPSFDTRAGFLARVFLMYRVILESLVSLIRER